MSSLIHITAFLICFSVKALGEGCCLQKTVGEYDYTYVGTTDEASSYNCKEDCLYSMDKDKDPTRRYCFKHGNLKYECNVRPEDFLDWQNYCWKCLNGDATPTCPPCITETKKCLECVLPCVFAYNRENCSVCIMANQCEICADWCDPIIGQEHDSCDRDCTDTEPRNCTFNFTIEDQQSGSPGRVVDGGKRSVLTYNGLIPGPPIVVCEGDTVVLNLLNNITDGNYTNSDGSSNVTTIHFHGIREFSMDEFGPWSDGVPFVTQCPITPNKTFQHKFLATRTNENAPPGTYWYHSHVGAQRTNGAYGALIIKPKETDDQVIDEATNTILLNEWYESVSDLTPRSILINGNGRVSEEKLQGDHEDKSAFLLAKESDFSCVSNEEYTGNFTTNYTEFNVLKNKTYRFRIIGAISQNSPLHLEIENHTFSAIAADSRDIEPVDNLTELWVAAGERFDILIKTKQDPGLKPYKIKVYGNVNQNAQLCTIAWLIYPGQTVDYYYATPCNCSGIRPPRTNTIIDWHYGLPLGGIFNCVTPGMNVTFVKDGKHNVNQINKTTYENCTLNNPIGTTKNFTFAPNSTGMFYFACGLDYDPSTGVGGHCEFGHMKARINVVDKISDCSTSGSTEFRRTLNPVPNNPPDFNARLKYPDWTNESKSGSIYIVDLRDKTSFDSNNDNVNTHYIEFPGTISFNNISMTYPHVPFLLQDPKNTTERCPLNNTQNITNETNCQHVLEEPWNKTGFVEIILINNNLDETAAHPIHQHGGWYQVVGEGQYNQPINRTYIMEQDKDGKLTRNRDSPPSKDTIQVPNQGYVILRTRLDNAGTWIVHCHIEFHLGIGMALVLQIGNFSDWNIGPLVANETCKTPPTIGGTKNQISWFYFMEIAMRCVTPGTDITFIHIDDHNVNELSEANFTTCNVNNPNGTAIDFTWTAPNSTGMFYFACGLDYDNTTKVGGHCQFGNMKAKIHVVENLKDCSIHPFT